MWQNPTPNQQMQHFLHRKTDTFKFPTHGTMYYIVVYVYIIEVYMLLAVFMFIFINFLFDCRRVSFPHFELTTKCASGE